MPDFAAPARAAFGLARGRRERKMGSSLNAAKRVAAFGSAQRSVSAPSGIRDKVGWQWSRFRR